MNNLYQILFYGGMIGLNIALMATALSWIFKYNRIAQAFIACFIEAALILYYILKIIILFNNN